MNWGEIEEPDFDNMPQPGNIVSRPQTPADDVHEENRWEKRILAQQWKKAQMLVKRGLITTELNEAYGMLREVITELGDKGDEQATALIMKLDEIMKAAATMGELSTADQRIIEFKQMVDSLVHDPAIDEATKARLLSAIDTADAVFETKSVQTKSVNLQGITRTGSDYNEKAEEAYSRNKEVQNEERQRRGTTTLQGMVPQDDNATSAAKAAWEEASKWKHGKWPRLPAYAKCKPGARNSTCTLW